MSVWNMVVSEVYSLAPWQWVRSNFWVGNRKTHTANDVATFLACHSYSDALGCGCFLRHVCLFDLLSFGSVPFSFAPVCYVILTAVAFLQLLNGLTRQIFEGIYSRGSSYCSDLDFFYKKPTQILI